MKKIYYNGIERCDFVYDLALVLSQCAPRVILNDVSQSQDLSKSIIREEDTTYDWRNILFTKKMNEKKSTFDPNDIYIEYRGKNIVVEDDGHVSKDTVHLIMPDYTKKEIEIISTIDPEGEGIYIMRDYCGGLSDRDISLACNITADVIAGHIELDANDIALYQALTMNGSQPFYKCSKDMKMALSYVLVKVLGVTSKEANKLVKTGSKLK